MAINPEIWQWLYLPLTLVGLCLCLHFGYFTKQNLLAWLASLVLCYAGTYLAVSGLSALRGSIGFCMTYTVLNIAFMIYYFYIYKKRTPFSEFFSFTLFTSTSFGIVGVMIIIFLWALGILY